MKTDRKVLEICIKLRDKLNDLHHEMFEEIKDEEYQVRKDVRTWFYNHLAKQSLHCYLREQRKHLRKDLISDLLMQVEKEMEDFEKT